MKALAFLVAEQMIPNKKFAQDTESIKHNPYMREFARYFSMVTLVEEKLDPGKSHLIASYPHGTYVEWSYPVVLGFYTWLRDHVGAGAPLFTRISCCD